MTSEPAGTQEPIRFGEDLVLDFRAYELRRAGRVLKLERIPMELLLFLVEQRGRLVSREQIVERIWGRGVNLDADNSINGAIRKIRKALRDDPERPRVIQTVTGKGYRFIAPVAEIGESREPAAPAFVPAAAAPQPAPVTHADESRASTLPMAAPAAAAPQPSAATQGNTRRLRRSPIVLGVVMLLATLGIALGWLRWRIPPRAATERLMLAVLPFQNLTGDVTQEYLSDGLTEEIIAQLGKLDPHHLGVIARTSSMHYKNTQARLDEIGRELGVQFVVEGTVRRDPGKVRVSAQLIEVSDQTHLWARQYDREPGSLLSLQGEIAQEVADEIQLTLGERKSSPTSRAASSSGTSDAYDLYLRGQYFWNKRTIEGLRQAIDYCQKAIAADPIYAPAYAGLANSYVLLGGYSGEPQIEFMSKARAASLRALELDQGLPEAHTALALIVQNYDWDWQTAEKEYRRAIELNPNYATAHHWYAEHLAYRGRFDDALAESEIARRLDPLSLIIAVDMGAIQYYSRRYDRAVAKLNAVLAMDPGFERAHIVRNAYVEQGRFEDALADIESDRVAAGTLWKLSSLAYVYGRAGRRAEAERALVRLLELNRHQEMDPAIISWAYAGMGDTDQALAWLEKAYAQHSNLLATLKVEPGYDALRGNPRFRDLLHRVGLSE